jgi:hypothetical protein
MLQGLTVSDITQGRIKPEAVAGLRSRLDKLEKVFARINDIPGCGVNHAVTADMASAELSVRFTYMDAIEEESDEEG